MSTNNRQSASSLKKTVRQTYAQQVKQLSKMDKQKGKLQKILSINFGEDSMIVVSKRQLIIYSILTLKVFYTRQGYFWDAVFLPNTTMIALIEHDGTSKSTRTLRILDLQKDKIIASMTISFQIEKIKANQNSICMVGAKQLCIVHFPTLKPICHELAGSGLNIIFDISYQGLTLAYQTQRKGFVTVHNFSSISTQRARRKSHESFRQRSSILGSFAGGAETPKRIVQIKAHHEYISLIRLSPNGSRIATTSHKGTMIRIFLTQNGKLWEELRVGYQLCKILDMNFYEQGNVISCITEKSMVFLYNLKLQTQQQQVQNEKRGYKIYQQGNPKSIFSFLSFFYNNFGNEHPFAFFQLLKPMQENKENKKQKQQAIVPKNLPKPINLSSSTSEKQIVKQQASMEIIKQQSQLLHQDQKASKQVDQKYQEITIENIEPREIMQNENQSISGRSMSILSQTKSKRTKSLLKKLNVMQSKKDNYDHIGKIYNTVSKIYIGGDNFVWVAKGPYIFTLKYDPFNGGEMFYKDTVKFC